MDITSKLLRKLDSYPRIKLTSYPTPLEELPSISRLLGRRLFIKRDDEIGPGLGGNKTRKLEFLIADALEKQNTKVLTFGGLQSNHARLTAAVAVKVGMEPHLFYFEKKPDSFTGNLLVNELLGARMHFIPLGGSSSNSMRIETISNLVKWISRIRVGKNYYIPVGGHSWLGCLGHVQAAIEINQQAIEFDIPNAWIITAVGSGGTLAGLLAGFKIINSNLKLIGIDVGSLWKNFPASIAKIATEITNKLGFPYHFTEKDIPIIENTYVGERYGIPSKEGLTAIHLLTSKEGILLDPVYTSKAFSGLLGLINKNTIRPDEQVIFLHTGGTPALFAFEEQVINDK